MALSGCSRIIKYLLVFANLIFLAVGLLVVILAVWMLRDLTFLVSLTQEQHNFYAGIYILLAAGTLLLIASFFGCYGSLRESQCMLVAFFCGLLVVVVAQIAAGAWLFSNGHRLEELVKATVTETVKNEYGVIDYRTQTIDTIQSEMMCCGSSGPGDWAASKYADKNPYVPLSLSVTEKKNMFKVPESCCKAKGSLECSRSQSLVIGQAIPPGLYSDGCSEKLFAVLKNQSTIFFDVTLGVGILELLSLIFSLVLCCAIGSSDRYKA